MEADREQDSQPANQQGEFATKDHGSRFLLGFSDVATMCLAACSF
jgi:hypothetical protein